jgi:hypothetical protein
MPAQHLHQVALVGLAARAGVARGAQCGDGFVEQVRQGALQLAALGVGLGLDLGTAQVGDDRARGCRAGRRRRCLQRRRRRGGAGHHGGIGALAAPVQQAHQGEAGQPAPELQARRHERAVVCVDDICAFLPSWRQG